MLEHPKFAEAAEWSDEEIEALVEAQLSHPAYIAALEWTDEEIEALVKAQMAHPSQQYTPAEECVTTILMAAVMAGHYALPPDSESNRLCEWYSKQYEQ